MTRIEAIEAEIKEIDIQFQALNARRDELVNHQRILVADSLGLIGATIECRGKRYAFHSINRARDSSQPWINARLIKKDGTESEYLTIIYREWKIVKEDAQ